MTDYYLRLKVVAATGFGQGYESCAFSGSSGIGSKLVSKQDVGWVYCLH